MPNVAASSQTPPRFHDHRRSDEYRLTLILAPPVKMYNRMCRAVAVRSAENKHMLKFALAMPIAALSLFATPALACGGYGYGSCGCGCGVAGYAAPVVYGYGGYVVPGGYG